MSDSERGNIVYLNSNVGLGDQLLGYISCFWVAKILDLNLYCNNEHIRNVLDVGERFVELNKLTVISIQPETSTYNILRTVNLKEIFKQYTGVTSGQNFFSILYINPHTCEHMKQLCPVEVNCVLEFFKQVKMLDSIRESINHILLPSADTVAIHYRTQRQYNDDACQLIPDAYKPFVIAAKAIGARNILLITDDKEVFSKLQKDDFQNVYCYSYEQAQHSGTSNSIEADRRAFIEMYLIGQCKEAIISYWSNFSRLAIMRTLIPFYITKMLLDTDDKSNKWLDGKKREGCLTLEDTSNIRPIPDVFRRGYDDELLTKHKEIRPIL